MAELEGPTTRIYSYVLRALGRRRRKKRPPTDVSSGPILKKNHPESFSNVQILWALSKVVMWEMWGEFLASDLKAPSWLSALRNGICSHYLHEMACSRGHWPSGPLGIFPWVCEQFNPRETRKGKQNRWNHFSPSWPGGPLGTGGPGSPGGPSSQDLELSGDPIPARTDSTKRAHN